MLFIMRFCLLCDQHDVTSFIWMYFFKRMRVSCDETHLHYIQPYQFVDSPEWEANREQSDDVFQVGKEMLRSFWIIRKCALDVTFKVGKNVWNIYYLDCFFSIIIWLQKVEGISILISLTMFIVFLDKLFIISSFVRWVVFVRIFR